MAYTYPDPDAVALAFAAGTYTRPGPDEVSLSFAPGGGGGGPFTYPDPDNIVLAFPPGTYEYPDPDDITLAFTGGGGGDPGGTIDTLLAGTYYGSVFFPADAGDTSSGDTVTATTYYSSVFFPATVEESGSFEGDLLPAGLYSDSTFFPAAFFESVAADTFYGSEFFAAYAVELYPVKAEYSVMNRDEIGVELLSSFAINGTLGAEFDVSFSIGPPYEMVGVELECSVVGLIGVELASQNHLWSVVGVELYAAHSSTAEVGIELFSGNAILDHSEVGSELSVPFTYLTGGVIGTDDVSFLQGSNFTVELDEVDISCDDGSPVWHATCTLSDVADIQKFSLGDAFTILLEGEPYAFIVDSRAVDRGAPGDARAKVFGMSPIVAYQHPRAKKMSKTWKADTSASAIAAELIPGIAWSLVDSHVSAGVFGMENATPYEAVVRLAEAAGGIVGSLPDGAIQVRDRHPTSTTQYGDATAAHTLSDMEDNFSSSERYTPNVLVDLLTIGDTNAESANDRVEFVQSETEPSEGTIRVYPQVWRDAVSARATGVLSIAPPAVASRTETDEVVEFKEGRAQVRFPVDALTSVEWLTANLGSVIVQPYSSQLMSTAGDGYSMAKITYTTKCHEFPVRGKVESDPVQVIIEDIAA